jgi:Fic family protein
VNRGISGHYALISAAENVKAFIPNPLPPVPPLQMSDSLQEKLSRAMFTLGQLDGISQQLPDPELFLYSYVRKEAVLSSQIEGTQSSLSDLLLFEAEGIPSVPLEDVKEVSSCVAALTHGLKRIREGFPVSLRLIKEIHRILLAKGRGSNKESGELRRSQNWIGGSRPGNALFVPPPPEAVIECMSALEKFVHGNDSIPSLIKAALVHVQFETVHPFLDGNGRVGRLLITLLLCAEGLLREPLLYLSLYFKRHRAEYYDFLQVVRGTGDWEAWLEFFLQGVRETASQAVDTANELIRIAAADKKHIQQLGKSASSAMRLHELLQRRPVLTISSASDLLGLSIPSVTNAVRRLQKIEIVREVTGRKRNKSYAYTAYVNILNRETEPLNS